ncbi:MAG: Abi family protein [Acetatifactor muris]|nr:Abi family protein [Acetatifactor muris]MCM1526591.1 Abi family protein [Bacteroides sp.]
MADDKIFRTYNQQMRRLRNGKKIECEGSKHKQILIRAGYFNIINGYKTPFTCGTDASGSHVYLPNTDIDQLYALKKFDDRLRLFLLDHITRVEEEVRTLTGYKFDQCNSNGKIPWYDTTAYSPSSRLQSRMNAISSAYSELSSSQQEYVRFYMENHTLIPTWIMIKVVNFSTFINVLQNSKTDVTHSICKLYGMLDQKGYPNVKLLIGSLHWLRKVRNSCAHNERIYCIHQSRERHRNNSGRIIEHYISSMAPSYSRDTDKRVFDLLVYFKYYLPDNEYHEMISVLQDMLNQLQCSISKNAFDNVRGQMGIKDLNDLDTLKKLPKDPIKYNQFDSLK